MWWWLPKAYTIIAVLCNPVNILFLVFRYFWTLIRCYHSINVIDSMVASCRSRQLHTCVFGVVSIKKIWFQSKVGELNCHRQVYLRISTYKVGYCSLCLPGFPTLSHSSKLLMRICHVGYKLHMYVCMYIHTIVQLLLRQLVLMCI